MCTVYRVDTLASVLKGMEKRQGHCFIYYTENSYCVNHARLGHFTVKPTSAEKTIGIQPSIRRGSSAV